MKKTCNFIKKKFVSILAIILFLIGLYTVNQIEKKYFPIDLNRNFLQQNIISFDIAETDDELVEKAKKEIKNKKQLLYYVLENDLVQYVRDVNSMYLFDKNSELKLYVVQSQNGDILNPTLNSNSGKIKKKLLITINDSIKENSNRKFNIVNIPDEKVLFILDLVTGQHNMVRKNNIVGGYGSKNFEIPNNLITIVINNTPLINMVHMMYEDFSCNKNLVTYLIYECNCLQMRNLARTDVKSIMLIALSSTDINNVHFLKETHEVISKK